MGYDLDLQALMSSEIFRNYLEIELQKEAELKKDNEDVIKQKQFSDMIERFAKLELSIKENRFLKQQFLDLQKQISTNQKFANELGSQFVNAIMMLDLEDSGE